MPAWESPRPQDYSGDGRADLFVTNSRSQGHAAFRTTERDRSSGTRKTSSHPRSARAARAGASRGSTWTTTGGQDLVLANGEIPAHEPEEERPRRSRCSRTSATDATATPRPPPGCVPGPSSTGVEWLRPTTTTTGVWTSPSTRSAASLILLHNTGGSRHWLEVSLGRFVPGAVVTAVLPDGTAARPRGSGGKQLPLERGSPGPLRPGSSRRR